MGEDQVAAGKQRDDHGNAEDKLERGPQHAHELDKTQGAGDVLAVEPFEEAYLRLLAGKGADQAGAGVVLLGLRGDLGEAGLDALEAVVNPVAKVLDQDAGHRHGRQSHQGEPGADAQQEKQGEYGEEDGVGAERESRAQQHAHGIQVIGHSGHNVAGAVALIEARVLPLQVAEEVVAQVELNLPRDADENPALGIEKDALGERNSDQQACEAENRFAVGLVLLQFVDGPSQDSGKLDRRRIGGNARESAPQVSPAVAAHVTEERAQIAEHGFIVRGTGERSGSLAIVSERLARGAWPTWAFSAADSLRSARTGYPGTRQPGLRADS